MKLQEPNVNKNICTHTKPLKEFCVCVRVCMFTNREHGLLSKKIKLLFKLRKQEQSLHPLLGSEPQWRKHRERKKSSPSFEDGFVLFDSLGNER